jgi:hypothetical protein
MVTLSSKQVAELVALAERLARFAKLLQTGPRKVDAAKKMAERICLACDAKCPEGERYRRGLDVAHYTHALRIMDSGDATEQELMAAGRLGPKKKTGKPRKASHLDDFEKTDAATEGAQMTERIQKAAAAKGQRKKPQ